MGFRFFKRLYILPGVSLNLSKSGISFSFGFPGARLTLGKRGIRKTIGLPGTGMYYTTNKEWDKSNKQKDELTDAEIDE